MDELPVSQSSGFLKNKKVIFPIVSFVVILAAVSLGVYLVQQKQIFSPKAVEPTTVATPETSMALEGYPTIVYPGTQFAVSINVKSDIDAANLFTAKLKFPSDLLEVKSATVTPVATSSGSLIITSGSVIQNWVENFYDNQEGVISLVGGVPSPGLQTQAGNVGSLIASITFGVKKVGEATISFDPESAIYRNSDNMNILNIKKDATVKIMAETTPSPTPVSQTEGVSVKVSCAAAGDQIYPAGPHIDAYISGAVNYPAYNGDTNQMFWTTLVETETGQESILSADAANRTVNVAVNVHGQTSPIRGNVIFPLQTGKSYEGRVYVAPWVTSTPVFTAGQLLSETDFTTNCTAPGITVTPTPLPVKGDVNADSKVTLVDMSALLTQWGQDGSGADLNGDGVVNSIDYALMKSILIEAKIIRSTI